MKQIVFLLSLALSLLFCSCSADESLCSSSTEVNASYVSIDEEKLSTDSVYAKSVLLEFINQYPEIYGEQIFVFPDLESQENALQEINGMDYVALRSWQKTHG